MQEVFEKIIEKLEEQKEYYKDIRKNTYCRVTETDNCDSCKADYYLDARLETINSAIEIVKQEAEQYNNGWIACSERLPDEYGDYLVTWKPLHMIAEDIIRKVGRAIPHYYEIVEYDPDDEELWIGSIEQEQGEYEIIAWQPLPKPYQPNGE